MRAERLAVTRRRLRCDDRKLAIVTSVRVGGRIDDTNDATPQNPV